MIKIVKVKGESKNFKPGPESVLVKVDFIDHEVSAGGIFIPINRTSCLDRPTHGKVIRVGKGVTEVKEGDIIHWPEECGMDFEFDDCKCTTLREQSILCVVE